MADDIQSNIRINVDTANAMDSIRLLQNQISAFHQQMSKMGAASVADSRNMQQNLINSINSTGQFTANMTRVRTTAEQFSLSLEKNKLSMGEYFRYAGASTKSFGKLFAAEFETINKVARERVKDLQSQYIKLGRDANGAMQAIKVRPLMLDMENLGTKTQIAAQRQQLLNQLLKQGSTNLLNFGKNTQWAGRQLMVGFTIPLSIMGSAAMKAYKDIEEAGIRLKRVYGDLGTTNAETEKMVKQVQSLALEYTKYGVAVKDSMDMAATAAATGKKGADLLAQVASSARLAVLGGVDQQMALKTTISLTDAFGVSAKNLGKNIDFLNAVENQTVLSIEDMTTAIPKAAPVIQQLGGDVKDLAFFLTAMKEGGINASEGANAIKSGLASLINPTNTASKMLAGFGINLREIVQGNKGDVKKTVIDFAKALDQLDPLNRAKAIEQLFGKFQFARMSTLFKNVIEQGSQASEVLRLASKTSLELSMLSQKELNKISESPLYKFQKAIADFQAQLAPVGEQFMKAITPLINFGTDVLKNFNSLGDGVKGFIVKFVSVAGVIGPVLLMSFGLIANAVANVIKGFALVKDIFNKTGKSSLSLGEQVNYMTQEQIQAAAIASSLDQVHSKLKQTFTSEAAAVDMLTAAYERSVAAQRAFGIPIAHRGPVGKGPVGKYAAGGIIRGPGTGTSDSILAMVSNGEAIIPAKSVARNPGIVQQLVSGNIPGFARGLFDDPYDLATKVGLTKRDVVGRPGADPQIAQIHARDAIEAGHTLASKFKTADQFLADIEVSMREMGYSQANINKALKDSKTKFEKQAEFLRAQGKSEQEILDYKFQTYSERTILQPGPVNNKGTGSFLASEVKDFYKPGKEGSFAFANLAPHLKSLKFTDQEIEKILSDMATGLNTSLSKIEGTAKMTLADLDKLTNDAIDDAVKNNARAKQAIAQIDSADYTFKTAKFGDNSRVAIGESYKGKQGKRIEELERMIGVTSPYQTGGRTIFTRGTFEAAGAQYSPRATQQALRQLQNAGGKFEAEANLLIRQYAEKGAAFIPELFKRIEKQLSKIGLTSLPEIEATIARNAGTISTSIVNGVEKGFNVATQRNSPPKKLIQAGKDSGNALVSGARSQLDDAALAGKAIGATISQNALGGTRVMSEDIITPATQAQQVARQGNRRVIAMNGYDPLTQSYFPPVADTMGGIPFGPQPATKFQQSKLGKASTRYNNFFTSTGIKVANMDPGKFQGKMFGGSMAAGMASMILPGAAGQVAGTASMVMGIGGMFKNLGPVVGKLIPVFGKLIPGVGIAITAFEAFDKIVLPLIRKNADSFNSLADTLNITKDKIKGINDFFGTEGKLSGVRASIVASGIQTGEQASIAQQFQQSEQFKSNFEESANKMQSLSKQEFERAMQGMAIDLAGQGYDPEAVKAIIDAIAIQAKQSSVSIVPELFSLENPETKSLMNKNIKSIFADTSKNIKDLAGQSGGYFNTNDVQKTANGEYDNFFAVGRSAFADPETLSKLKANVSELSSYMSGLSAQFANGQISVKEYNLQYEKLISLAQQQPGTSGIDSLRAAFVLLNAEIGGALSQLNDIQFAAVSDAILAGVVSTKESLDAIYYGTETQKQEQIKNYTDAAKQLKESRDKKTTLQKQITGLQNTSGNIAKTEQAINDKYDKRIAQIEKIKKLNDQIAQSQQGQLTLAEALNQGDIGAAARAAIDIQKNDVQNALDRQQTGLEDAKKAELSSVKNSQEANTAAINRLTTTVNELSTEGITVKNVENAGPAIQSSQGNDPLGWLNFTVGKSLDFSLPGVIFNAFKFFQNPQKFIKDKTSDYIPPGYAIDKSGKLLPQRQAAVKPYTGGHITGPGTGTSDSIPAMLSNGEYVIRANAVKTIGIDTLDKLNQADRLGFAAGGMVNTFKKKKPKPYISNEKGLPTNENFPADTTNFQDMHGWMVARPGAGVDDYGREVERYSKNDKTGKYEFDSAMDAYTYYDILIKNRRKLVPHIEKKYKEHLSGGWMYPDDANNFRISNLVANKTYGPFNGLTQTEAKTFAKSIIRVYGQDSLPKMWKQFGLDPKLLGKPIKLTAEQKRLYNAFSGELTPSLPQNAPRFSYYANGGLVSYKNGGKAKNWDLKDPSAPWNQGDYKKFNDYQTRKQYWAMSQPGSREIVEAGKTAGYFTPGIGSGLAFGDAGTAFGKGDVGGGLLNTAFGFGAMWIPKVLGMIGKGITGARSSVQSAIAAMNAKKILAIMGGKEAAKLTPQIGLKMNSSGLENFISENKYKSIHEGVRSAAGDSIAERLAIESAIGMNKGLKLKPGQSPVYGFLSTREAVPFYHGSVYANSMGQSAQQLKIDKFNKMINPYSRPLQSYGSTVVNLKPGALKNATVSFGDSLSIYQQAVKSGMKTPQVMRLGSLLTTLRLSSMAKKTKNILGKDFEMPYAEIHMGSGFGLDHVSGIGVSNEFKDRVPQAIAAVEEMLAKVGKSNIPVHDIIGKGKDAFAEIGQSMPKAIAKATMKNPFANLSSIFAKKSKPTLQKPITYDTMFGPKTRGQGFDELNIDGMARERGGEQFLTQEELHYLTEYVAKPYTLHGSTFDYRKNQIINAILRNKFKIDKGTEIVRVANVSDMNLLKDIKPGQTRILDQFLSVANKNHPSTQNFIDNMMSGKVDTGGRGTGNYPLIKFNVKTDIPGINDINNIKSGLSDVSDGLLAPGTGIKLVKVTKAKDGKLIYHVDLGTNINAKYGFNQKGTADYYKNLANSLPTGNKYKNNMLQTALEAITKPIDNSKILDFIRSQGGRYANGGMVMPSPEPAPTQYAIGGMVRAATGGMLIDGKMYGGFAKGGIVPSKFAMGGYAMGTDTVPAMLTPGEFVIKKSAVDRIGTSTLNKINRYADGGLVGGSSAAVGDSVYNNTYEINVNVSSASNPNDIANAVMRQIRQIDNARVRGLN